MKTLAGILLRYLLVWVINALALLLATTLLPGFRFDTSLPHWWTVLLTLPVTFALLVIALRPVLVLLTLPLNAVTLGVPTLFLNAVPLYLAANIEGRIIIDSLLDAFFGLAIVTFISTSLIGLLGIDETYPFFQTILTRLGRRLAPAPPAGGGRGLLILQIDGLSHASLRRALARGRMPGLSGLLARGGHVLTAWNCGLPSNTPAVQAGLFYGARRDAPGYRWYDRQAGRLREASAAGDLRRLEAAAAAGLPPGGAPLLRGGSVINSFFAGGAAKRLLTVTALGDPDAPRSKAELRDFQLFWLSPHDYAKAVVSTVWDVLTAVAWEAIGRFGRRRLRVRRGLRHHLMRAVANAFLREIAYFWLRQDLSRGVPVIFSNFVGYDEVAHYAGPDAYEARVSLAAFDRKLRRLLRLLRGGTPIAYDLVLLADHGQTASVPFRQLYGRPLEAMVEELAGAPADAAAREIPVGADVGRGGGRRRRRGDGVRPAALRSQYVAVLLEEMRASQVGGEAPAAARSRRTLERLETGGGGDPGAAAGVAVCVSGCLAHLYARGSPHPLDLEDFRARHPGLVEALASHPGLAFVAARLPGGGAAAIGADGVRDLASGEVRGDVDPLAPYPDPDLWAAELRRLLAAPSAGDLLLNGAWLSSGRVVVFEEQISSHGGLGGPQTEPFLVVPAAWGPTAADTASPEALHAFLSRRRVTASR